MMRPLSPVIRILAVAAAVSVPWTAGAQDARDEGDLADMSLEELANLRVTTASLRPERYLQTPAAIYVITGEDIHRSGARSLPEALRLAPNLEVARVSGSTYAVTARGFLNVITNKLLVLLDGRTLYTTVLSGVLWDAQDVMLEDVDRIEVISGPGAALYGANAFVGVINIITRTSGQTQGGLASASVGRNDSDAGARFGGTIGDVGTYRAYAMHIERADLRPDASAVADRMRKNQAGFRSDFGTPARGGTLQGDAYAATIDGNGAARVKLDGANLLARYVADVAGSRLTVQGYYDHTRRDDPATFSDRLDLYDILVQDDLPAWGAHRVSFGLGYRYAQDDTTPNPAVRFIPGSRRLHWASVVAQDEVTLAPTLTLTAGFKVQSDVYVSPEFMPDLRIAWKPDGSQLAWAAASRVARTPGRIDRDFFFPGNPPFFIRGGPDFRSETGTTYEIGYRAQPDERLTWSIDAFHTRLDDLRGGRPAPGGGAFVISNEVEGSTSGIEAWALLQVTERWRLTAGLLELHQDLRAKNGSGSLDGPSSLGNDPRHSVKLRSLYRVSDRVDFDVSWRYVSSLAYLSTVPGYAATDVRVAWRATPRLELSAGGYDVFHRSHVEFDEHGFPAAIPRSFYVAARLQF